MSEVSGCCMSPPCAPLRCAAAYAWTQSPARNELHGKTHLKIEMTNHVTLSSLFIHSPSHVHNSVEMIESFDA